MNPGNKYNQGHALLSALLLVVLLSILAINGFRNSLLESRIAGVDRTRALSFQQAESILLYSEQELVGRHLSEHNSRQWLFKPVSYAVPKTYHNASLQSDQPLPSPKISIQTISTKQGSEEASEESHPGQRITAVQVDVTTYIRNKYPAVQLQSISRIESSTGLTQRIAWRRIH